MYFRHAQGKQGVYLNGNVSKLLLARDKKILWRRCLGNKDGHYSNQIAHCMITED